MDIHHLALLAPLCHTIMPGDLLRGLGRVDVVQSRLVLGSDLRCVLVDSTALRHDHGSQGDVSVGHQTRASDHPDHLQGRHERSVPHGRLTG